MKHILKNFLMIVLITIFMVSGTMKVFAQTSKVTVVANFERYDILYLTDFLDIKTQKISPNITGMSINVIVNDNQDHQVFVIIKAFVQFQGDNTNYGGDPLITATTNTFTLPKTGKTITARDLASESGGEIYILTHKENEALQKRFEDMATKITTAPPGKYMVTAQIFDAPNNPISELISHTILIPLSTPEEANIEIIEPKDGSCTNNLAPTFTWTTSISSVMLSVFEVGSSNRSPQDALNGGNPYLIMKAPEDFVGNSLTYPPTAPRKLQQNKAYVLQVAARVQSNRGEILRTSRPAVFRITDDNVGRMLDNFLNTFSGPASATYSSLRAEPSNWVAWSDYGNITLDGNILSNSDLQALINDLASRTELKLQLGVENQ